MSLVPGPHCFKPSRTNWIRLPCQAIVASASATYQHNITDFNTGGISVFATDAWGDDLSVSTCEKDCNAHVHVRLEAWIPTADVRSLRKHAGVGYYIQDG